MPTAYFYARVSTIDQAVNGHSLKDQKRHLKATYKRLLKPDGIVRGPLLRDAGVSAWKYQLFHRADGQKLQLKRDNVAGLLEPGDCVVIDRIDRAFRNLRDLSHTIDYWHKAGIRVIFRQLEGMDTSSAVGKLMVGLLGLVAEFDSNLKSERIRERNAIARQQGTPLGQVPLGFEVKHGKKGNRLRPDWRQRRVMAFMLQLEEQGASHAAIKAQVLAAHQQRIQAVRPTLLTSRELEVLETYERTGAKSRTAKELGVRVDVVNRALRRIEKKLPPAPLKDGLDMSQVSKWLAAARRFRDEGTLVPADNLPTPKATP